MGADAARRQVHDPGDRTLDRRRVDLGGAEGVDVDRQRLGHADGIGELHRGALGHAGGDDVLGQVARRVGRRAVDLGRILARERPAAMRCRTAIGVDDDLAARQARVAIRPADHEGTGRVHPPLGLGREPALGQHLADIGLGNGANVVRAEARVEMLVREHHRGHAHRLAVLVAHRELRLGVGAKLRRGAGLARLGQALEHRVRVEDRRRHHLGRLVGGVAEHDALIARPLVAALAGHALRDMGRLLVQQVGDLAGFPVELVLLVADILDAGASDVGDALHVLVQLVLIGQADLAPDHHAIGGGEGLAGDARQRVLGKKRVEHGIGDPVADLIRVALGHGFRSESVILSGHICSIGYQPSRQEAVVTGI